MKENVASPVFEDLAHKWMKKLGIAVNKDFITQELQAHPDYPALTSLIDFLDMGGMKYYALESEKKYITEFNYPVLAHIKEAEGKGYLIQVNTPHEWDENEILATRWSGIVLIPDEHPSWEYEANTQIIKQERILKLFAAATVLIILLAIGYVFRNNLQPLTIGWGLLSLTGVAISIMTIATELGMQIKLVKEVCNSVSPRGCDAVLKSKEAKGVGGISVAHAALSYFIAQFAFFIFSSSSPALLYTGMVVSLPLIIVAGISLYSQKFIVKKWCALCLGIVAVLAVQSLVTVLNFSAVYASFQAVHIIAYFITMALICASLVPVKNGIKSIREQMSAAQDLMKWKRDSDLFAFQWNKNPYINTNTWKEELQLGNPEAALQLTIACNPYCGPCANTHKVLDKLHHIYKEVINIQIRLTCDPDHPTDKKTIAVKAILEQATILQSDAHKAQMLSDWFEWMNLEKWQLKWAPVQDKNVTALMKKHAEWMKTADIKGTPTIFINGRELPRKYLLEDLFQLIPVLVASTAVAGNGELKPMALTD